MFEKKNNKSGEFGESSNVLKPSPGSAKVHIGNGVKIKGEITDADEVQVDGQADLVLQTNNLMVGGTGQLKGNITSNNLDVWGKLEGDVKVNNTLTIQEEGIVEGSIEYQELHIKLGGKIKGDVKSLDKLKNINEAKRSSLQDSIEESKVDLKK